MNSCLEYIVICTMFIVHVYVQYTQNHVHCTLYIVEGTLFTWFYTVYMVLYNYTVYIVQCTVYNVPYYNINYNTHCTIYIEQYTVYSVLCTLYSIVGYTVHYTVYPTILYCTVYNVECPVLCTLYVVLDILLRTSKLNE